MSPWRENLRRRLKRQPTLFAAARKAFRACRALLRGNVRGVFLADAVRYPGLLLRMRNEPGFHSIVDDLLAFTGLIEPELERRLRRVAAEHHENEFRWRRPRSVSDLAWFYRSSYSFLFANAVHPYWTKLDVLTPDVGRVLDYGAGVGSNTLGLAKRGFQVDYHEISILQESFVRFRAARHGLTNIRFLSPYKDGRFEPLRCITDTYGAIVLKDVLEHIPDYHVLLGHLIDHLKPGGLIVEYSPFDASASGIEIHLKPAVPIEAAMRGMTRIEAGLWRKNEPGRPASA